MPCPCLFFFFPSRSGQEGAPNLGQESNAGSIGGGVGSDKTRKGPGHASEASAIYMYILTNTRRAEKTKDEAS